VSDSRRRLARGWRWIEIVATIGGFLSSIALIVSMVYPRIQVALTLLIVSVALGAVILGIALWLGRTQADDRSRRIHRLALQLCAIAIAMFIGFVGLAFSAGNLPSGTIPPPPTSPSPIPSLTPHLFTAEHITLAIVALAVALALLGVILRLLFMAARRVTRRQREFRSWVGGDWANLSYPPKGSWLASSLTELSYRSGLPLTREAALNMSAARTRQKLQKLLSQVATHLQPEGESA
jgi:hypothetical protein